MISGVTNWLTCGTNVVDRWLFGEDDGHSDSSESGESQPGSDKSDDTLSSSSDDSDNNNNKNKVTTTSKNSNNNNNKSAMSASKQATDTSYTPGQLYSWGYNFFGQCGYNQDELEKINVIRLPRQVTSIKVSKIACGDSHALAILPDVATVVSWGCNRWGQLGHGDQVNRLKPAPISGISPSSVPEQVAAGMQHSLVLSKYGELYTFGCGTYGRLGHGNELPAFSPKPVGSLVGKHIVNMAAGLMHSAAIDNRGQLYTWGWNRYGQLGIGSVKKHTLPVKNKELERVPLVKVVCGKNHTLVLTTEGSMYSFGFNICGQLGLNTFSDSIQPKKIEMPGEIVDIASGYYHSMCLTRRGAVYTWGFVSDGALGLGAVVGHQSKPTLIPYSHIRHQFSDSADSYNDIYDQEGETLKPDKYASGDIAVRIAAGGWHSGIITNSGKLYTFGFGDSHRLGTGSDVDQDIPSLVMPDQWGVEREEELASHMDRLELRKIRSSKGSPMLTGTINNRLNSSGGASSSSSSSMTSSSNNNISSSSSTLNDTTQVVESVSSASIKQITQTRVVNVQMGAAFTLATVRTTTKSINSLSSSSNSISS
ncbi:hypothetical protein SAMD00019534_079370 [Acytostelium subglobosum LB1]|uniref:hypothetical protein n=1 Tax=Acytostelium subglobosum LB1 TaxID=1410327 RepID=UPI000644ED1D|nr:hypothetical protein SAMD00019534_079370 [Acytostelium subglobosum LB1]GAM24762.1 hypothetical protein SAMD00019534_079370 [Acytostelium subglobosum LB1]|eukprot:XP_012752431.1 hypothetical protein SAMD00019534_079370 [Acytostelium subglobosum LB1]